MITIKIKDKTGKELKGGDTIKWVSVVSVPDEDAPRLGWVSKVFSTEQILKSTNPFDFLLETDYSLSTLKFLLKIDSGQELFDKIKRELNIEIRGESDIEKLRGFKIVDK